MMFAAATRASCIAITVGRRSRGRARSTRRRSRLWRSSAAGRTTSASGRRRCRDPRRPRGSSRSPRPPGSDETRGRACRAARRHRADRARHVYAGADIAADTGASPESPAATTRVRRSWSVRIPSEPSPSSTITADVGAAVISCRRLADRSCPGAQTPARREAATPPAGTADRRRARFDRGDAFVPDSSSERATKRKPAGADRDSRAASAPIR